MIEIVWQKSTLSRRPALLLPPATGTRRHRPAKGRRRQATSPPGVPPAVRRQLAARFDFRTRWMSVQAARITDHPVGAVGRATSPLKVTTTVPSRGWIAARQRKGPLVLSPHRRDGRHARLVRVFRRHRREVNGCQGKGAHVLVPRPRAMQATGGPVGGHPQPTEVVNRRLSSSIRRSNSVGARAQPTSSHQLLLTCRYPDVVDAMSVANWVATLTSIGTMPCHPRHHLPRDASSAANADVT